MKFAGVKISKKFLSGTPFTFNGEKIGYFSVNHDKRGLTMYAFGPIALIIITVNLERDDI